MQLSVTTSQIVGLGDERCWSQTLSENNLLITLELVSDGSFSAKDEGDKFLKGLAFLLNNRKPQEKTTFRILINQFLNTSLIINKINSLIVVLFLENRVFLFCKKSGLAFIKRGDLWSKIVSGEGFVSGMIQNEDLLIVATQTFKKLFPEEQILEEFSLEKDPQKAGEKLGALLHNFDNSKGAAAIFARFQENIPQTVPITSEPIEQQVKLPEETQVLETIQQLNIKKMDLEKKLAYTVNNPQTTVKPQASFPLISQIKNQVNKISAIFPRKEIKDPNQTTITYPKTGIREALDSPKKRILLAVIVLSVILLGSILSGVGSQRSQKKNPEFEIQLETINRQIGDGESLINLNNLQAKTLFIEAQSSLSLLQNKYKKGSKERIQIDELITRAESSLASATKIYKIDSPDTFLDLTAIKEGGSAVNFALYEDKLAVMDNKNISVITVDLPTLASQIVGGGAKTPDPTLITLLGNNVFVLSSAGLVKIDTVNKTQEVIVKDLKEAGQIAAVYAYGGNIYLLDNQNKKIWKVMALEKGYSEPRPYLASSETIGFTSVESLAIDGSVWVLGDSRVKKYTKGSETFISLEGLDTPLSNPEILFTSDENKYFYILDKNNSRVVVFTKEGIYDSQYLWPGISGVTDMVVSEKQKKILLLSGSTIYAIDLK